MANELSLISSLSYADAIGSQDSLVLTNPFNVTLGVLQFIHRKMLVGTSNTAIDLGSIATLGYFMAINRDANNTISIVSAVAGIVVATMLPGEVCGPFRFGSGITAPYAIATTLSSFMEYLLCSA